MAPSHNTAASSEGHKDLKFVLAAIAANDNFTPVWQTVAEKNGIAYGYNAAKKFRAIVKQHGYKLEDGKFMHLEAESESDNGAGTALKAPKKVAKEKNTKSTSKKRKIEAEDAEVDEE